jgi:hypothetical protein
LARPRGALSGDAKFIAAFEPIFASFEAANKRAMMLQPDFQLPKQTKLVTREELDAAFQRPSGAEVGDGWEGFRHHFPSSAGYLILSGVGFNSDRTIALVYVEHRCGGLCGAARYYILQKRDGRWVQYSPEGLKSEMRGDTSFSDASTPSSPKMVSIPKRSSYRLTVNSREVAQYSY